MPKVPNPVPPLDIANTPVHPSVNETFCNSAVPGVPPSVSVTFVSSVLVRAEGVIEGIEGKVASEPSPLTYWEEVPVQFKAIVPEVVIGDPLTFKAPLALNPTDVTVPVFDVQSGVKYSNAVAPVLTLNN